jgi:hypothetical protein
LDSPYCEFQSIKDLGFYSFYAGARSQARTGAILRAGSLAAEPVWQRNARSVHKPAAPAPPARAYPESATGTIDADQALAERRAAGLLSDDDYEDEDDGEYQWAEKSDDGDGDTAEEEEGGPSGGEDDDEDAGNDGGRRGAALGAAAAAGRAYHAMHFSPLHRLKSGFDATTSTHVSPLFCAPTAH